MEKNEIRKNVETHVFDADTELMSIARSKGYSIYGDVAIAIEQNKTVINEFADSASAYLASRKAVKTTLAYEQQCNWMEKYFKDNSLKKKNMEIQREGEIAFTTGVSQLALKGATYLIQTGLAKMDRKVAKESIWNFVYQYADAITHGPIEQDREITRRLWAIYKNLFNRQFEGDFHPLSKGKIYLPTDDVQCENFATMIYMIFMGKHMNDSQNRSLENDIELLKDYWAKLGIIGSDGDELYEKLCRVDAAGGNTTNRMSEALQGIYQNLMISQPCINMEQARKVNAEFLRYVPNGDKKLLAHSVTKVVENGLICGVDSMLSGTPVNLALLKVAATTAVSVFENLDDRTMIGNILAESGISESQIPECLDDAKKKQKTIPPIVVKS